MKPEPTYLLRLRDRGHVNGVPVVDVYLIRADGPAESAVLHSVGCGLSPASADHLAASFAALGVKVEKVKTPDGEPG